MTGPPGAAASSRAPLPPRAWLRAAVGLACAFAAIAALRVMAVPAGSPDDAPSRLAQIAIELRDAGGTSPATLDVSQLEVTLGDDAISARGLRRARGGEWNVLVYVDAMAAGPAELARAAEALTSAAAGLAALGPVTLVVADTLLEPWIEESTDAADLREAFGELGTSSYRPPGGAARDDAASRRALLLGELVRRTRGGAPQAVILAGDANAERSTGVQDPGVAAGRGQLAAAVASLGWVALPLHLGASGGGIVVSPLAEETGGEAVVSVDALRDAVDRLGERWLLGIEVPLTARAGTSAAPESSGAIAPLSLDAPSGTVLRAPRWLARTTPDFVVLARIEAALDADGGSSGALEVAATAELDSDAAGVPILAVEVITALPGGGATSRTAGRAGSGAATSAWLRASFVLGRLDEPPLVVHHSGSGVSLEGTGGWLLQARLDVPEDLEGVAVVVEDRASGAYGVALADLDEDAVDLRQGGARVAVESADLRAARQPAAARAAEPPLVRLVPPRERDLAGVQTFRAMALNAFIERVVFLLDGREVAEDRGDPFTARVDLGPDARQREVRAVAYDRAGRVLGEDALIVNRPRTAFDVDIVEVRGAAGAGGPIEVTAQVTAPARRRIERVEMYWNETLAATLGAPPWTAKLDVAPGAAGDYVRAVAYLDDGSSLEDVHLVGGGQGEEVEVNLVEVFAVVLDRQGSPVRDLGAGEISLRLAGKQVPIERFGVAEDLPLDVGLVIDTSQSMEILMDDTRAAAVRFLADLVRPGDRAFLVDFDSKPRLAQGITREMTDLIRALGSLRAGGNTALYDSILFSILHFEEGEDRRAVVLLTDGDDYQSRFSARQASLQARAAGVPIYMISLAGMDWMRPAIRKTDLETIAKQTGGHVFYVSAREELASAYARIGAELRSQYVLAFATPRALSEAELAKLEVRVSRPGTAVRAVVAGRSIQTR